MTRGKMYAMSVAGGVAAGLTWSGVSGFLLFIVFIPLFIVEQHFYIRREKVFAFFPFAFLFFVSWNITAVWWLIPVHIPGGISVIILNTLLMSFLFLLFSITKRNAGERSGYTSLIFYWLAYEYILLWGDLSWPWLHLGNGFAGDIGAVQWFSYTGVAGGSLWVLMVNILLFSAWRGYSSLKGARGYIPHLILITVIVAVPVIFSYSVFLADKGSNGEKIKIAVLQPNLDPYTEKFRGMNRHERVDDLLKLLREFNVEKVDYIVAPETAIDSVWLSRDNPHLKPLYDYLDQHNIKTLITGGTTFEDVPCSTDDHAVRISGERDTCYRVYNSSLQLLSGEMNYYHKRMLVPGVENLPFHSFIPLPSFLMVDLGGVAGIYSKGELTEVFSIPSVTSGAGQLVCFESAYGRLAADAVREGAGFLSIITNDGWFRGKNGYIQHLRLSRLRAIETGRPVVRSANTGVSAIIDRQGVILSRSSWLERGVVEGEIIPATEVTFYVAMGDYIGSTALFFTGLILLSLLVKRFSARDKTCR